MRKIFLILLLAVPIAAYAQSGTAGNADKGKQLFMKQNCYYCHGTTGQGGRDGSDGFESSGSHPVCPEANRGNAGVYRKDPIGSGSERYLRVPEVATRGQ